MVSCAPVALRDEISPLGDINIPAAPTVAITINSHLCRPNNKLIGVAASFAARSICTEFSSSAPNKRHWRVRRSRRVVARVARTLNKMNASSKNFSIKNSFAARGDFSPPFIAPSSFLFAIVVCQLSAEEKLQAARALLNDWTICFPALSASLS